MTVPPPHATLDAVPGEIGPGESAVPIAIGAATDERVGRWRRRVALAGKVLEIATQVLLVTLLPRLLGPAEFGRLMLAVAVVGIGTSVISLGAPSTFVRFLPAAPADRRAGLARAMTVRLLRVRGLQLSLVAVLAVGLAVAMPQRFAPREVTLLLVALAFDVLALIPAQIALGMGRAWVWSFRLAARNTVLLGAAPMVFVLGVGDGALLSVVLATAAGLAFAASGSVGLVRHATRGVPIPEGVARYGIVTGIGGLVGQFTYRGPVLAAGLLAGSAIETGFAALAGGVALAVLMAVREIFTVSLPEQVERWQRDRAQAIAVLRRLGWRATVVLSLMAIAGVATVEWALPLIAGDAFEPAVSVAIPVLALVPLLPVPTIATQAAALELRPGLSFAVHATGFVAFVAAAAVLTPLWGARGATAALLVAVAASSAFGTVALRAVVPPLLVLTGMGAALMVLIMA